jgi:hypothetical protein
VNCSRRFPRHVVATLFLIVAIIASRVEAIGGQLTLNWIDSATSELGLSIERSVGTTGTFAELVTTGPNATAYTDSSVADGMSYCYRVRAFNASGYSDYSNVACGAPPQTFGLAVVKFGAGSGTVTSTPTGITCGANCSWSYPSGTAVTLTATAASGSTFTGWSGGGCSGTGTCTVTLAATTTVTATFNTSATSFSLSTTKAGSGSGTIASSPAGISCGATCSTNYASGTVVTLTATAASGSTFAGWSGGGCSGTGSCTVTLTATTTVNATFDLQSVTLTVNKTGTGSGTVTSTPAGITCGMICSASYGGAIAVTLTATPASGSTFAGWSGACSGTGPCSPTMNANRTVTATFNTSATSFSLSTTKAGPGSGAVTSSPGGINCGATCSANYASGTVVTLTAPPASGSTFAGWSGACSGTGACILTMNGNRAVTATFNTSATSFSLSVKKAGPLAPFGTVTSSPSGINCGATCSASYASGTIVTLTATPAFSFAAFTGWSGACSGAGSCTVTMNAAATVTATFSVSSGTNALTVTKAGTGSGTVTSSLVGINCGATCSASYSSGTVVTLTATPAAGSTFAGWSGACSGTGACTLTMNGNSAVTATFNTSGTSLSLSVKKAGPLASFGTVTSSPSGINCGATCSASYASGTIVTLTATPPYFATFAGWSGACSGTGPCTVTMTTAQSVVATFVFRLAGL